MNISGQTQNSSQEKIVRRQYRIEGRCQGVGFRWTSKMVAESLGISGWVRNESDDSVTLVLQSTETNIKRFFEHLEAHFSKFIRFFDLFRVAETDGLEVEAQEDEFKILY